MTPIMPQYAVGVVVHAHSRISSLHGTERHPLNKENMVSTHTNDSSRRSIFKSLVAATTAFGAGVLAPRKADAAGIVAVPDPAQEAAPKGPLFSSVKVHNGLVYVAGKGEHGAGDISVHTKSVLDQIEAELTKVGSSMDKVLKVNVYLHDIKDYDAMNDAYRGRFGSNPPVRTTIACYGGIPGRSLVEIDCIAAV
jgi:2-iminobutanoate/2-iminopropanoate deaminase